VATCHDARAKHGHRRFAWEDDVPRDLGPRGLLAASCLALAMALIVAGCGPNLDRSGREVFLATAGGPDDIVVFDQSVSTFEFAK
jgi:hypothetical protein